MLENTDQNKSEYGHAVLRSVLVHYLRLKVGTPVRNFNQKVAVLSLQSFSIE